MSDVGYAWIQNALGVPDFLGAQRARLACTQHQPLDENREADDSLHD